MTPVSVAGSLGKMNGSLLCIPRFLDSCESKCLVQFDARGSGLCLFTTIALRCGKKKRRVGSGWQLSLSFVADKSGKFCSEISVPVGSLCATPNMDPYDSIFSLSRTSLYFQVRWA